ncbi:MAG: pyridoxamine 5'-phosphate oxidase family protein [Thermoplasmatota archaeon]
MPARSEVRRLPRRAAYDRATIDTILDEGIVAHVALVEEGGPVVIPTGYVRSGDRLLFHGSSASRLLNAMAAGQEVCVAVTLLDGLVLARAAFHHSMNYRSVVLFGRAQPILGVEAKRAALREYVERLLPGRWAEVRPPNVKEEAGTLVVEFPIHEASAKVRTGPPMDDPEDASWPAWAGVLPLRLEPSGPVQDPNQGARPLPGYLAGWRPQRP